MTITQGTDNNVHIAFLYRLLKFLCLPLLFGLILVVHCHSKIWGSFIYSSDFTQKSIWLWLLAAFNAGLKQEVQCMCSRLFMSEMIHKSEVKMNVNEGFSIFHTADACWHVLIISTNFGVHREFWVWIWPSMEFIWPAAVTHNQLQTHGDTLPRCNSCTRRAQITSYQYTTLISDLWPNGAVAITGATESHSCEKGQRGHLLSLK